MKGLFKLFSLLFLVFFSLITLAQESKMHTAPIPIEVFTGNRAINVLTVIAKPFKEKSKLGYFNFTNYTGDFKNSGTENEFASQSLLTYEVANGLSLTGGIMLNSATGFRKQLGMQYKFANPTWLVVLVPVIDLTDGHNLEMMNMVEFKPKLNDKWRLYSRLQGLYIYNPTDNHHARSYLTARVGLGFSNFQFGLGHTSDWYGEKRFPKTNSGVFARVLLN